MQDIAIAMLKYIEYTGVKIRLAFQVCFFKQNYRRFCSLTML